MRNIPTEIFVTWPTPNYEHPHTRGSALVIVNSICIALVIIAVLLRIYVRTRVRTNFGWDDFWIIPALICTIGLCAVVLIANTRFCWDRHIWDIPFSKLDPAMKVAFTAKLVFTFAATFTRISLLCFYYRLVRDTGIRKFTWAIHCGIVFVVAVCISFVALTVWQCSPVKAYWKVPNMPGSKCMNEGNVTLAAGVVNCVADLLVTCLPIPLIMRLQMPNSQRFGVMFLLCLGFIVTIAGVVRTYYIWKSLVESYDETWYAYPLWIAAAVEIDLGVLCACAPALRVLLHHPKSWKNLSAFISWRSSRSSSKRSTPDNSVNKSYATAESSEITALPPLDRKPPYHSPQPQEKKDRYQQDKKERSRHEEDLRHQHEKKQPMLRIMKQESFELTEKSVPSEQEPGFPLYNHHPDDLEASPVDERPCSRGSMRRTPPTRSRPTSAAFSDHCPSEDSQHGILSQTSTSPSPSTPVSHGPPTPPASYSYPSSSYPLAPLPPDLPPHSRSISCTGATSPGPVGSRKSNGNHKSKRSLTAGSKLQPGTGLEGHETGAPWVPPSTMRTDISIGKQPRSDTKRSYADLDDR